jgi:hypothetical protein
MILAIAVTLLTLPVAAVTVIGPWFWEIATPSRSRVEPRIRLLQVAEPHRLPVDPSISATAAGQAYYTLARVGQAEPREAYERDVPRQIDRKWIPDTESNPLGTGNVFDTLVARAGKGFGAEETSYLEQIASHPGFTEAAIVARASAVDYLGARLLPDHTLGGFRLPIPNLLEMRGASNAYLARAAFELSRGRRSDAEATLHEQISFGLAIAMEGHSLIEVLIGAVAVEGGLKSLEDFYTLTGQEPRARTLRAAREAATAIAADVAELTSAGEFRPGDPVIARRALLRRVRDRQVLRADRWEAANLLAVLPCTNAYEVIFGPSDELKRTFDIARSTLARFPSERRVLDNILAATDLFSEDSSTETGGGLPGMINAISRWSGWLFGSPTLMKCGQLPGLL